MKTCKAVLYWDAVEDVVTPAFCRKPATWHYPTMRGGFVHRCEEHAVKHHPYVTRIPEVQPADTEGA